MFAEPNGAGKTTLFSEILRGQTAFVNADEIAREINPVSGDIDVVRAGKISVERRERALEASEDLTMETTLSGNSALRFMRRAKQQGYDITLVYVGLQSIELSLARVAARVAAGGHDVPTAAILRLYPDSLDRVRRALDLADAAFVFDNSDEERPRVVKKGFSGWKNRSVVADRNQQCSRYSGAKVLQPKGVRPRHGIDRESTSRCKGRRLSGGRDAKGVFHRLPAGAHHQGTGMPSSRSGRLIMADAKRTHAVWIERFGGPEVVNIAVVSVPPLAPDDILVRMAVASVNPVDWKTAEGQYPPMGEDKLPFALGRDLSGVVEAVGADGRGWKAGDRVCALIGNDRGAQSEWVVAKPNELVAVPDGVDLVAAGAMPLAAMTAWQGLFVHGGLERGQRVLIHGAAGGVGHMAVQFARRQGAIVYATASGRDLDFVRALGAQTAIDYEKEKFEDVACDIDMVFDTLGGETQARSFGVIRKGGILVSTLNADEEMAARLGVRTVPRWHAETDADALGQVADLIAKGDVIVTVAKSFALEAVRDAYDFARTQHPRGKVVLTSGSDAA